MVLKVGINGFGRVGRIVARACLQNPSLQLSAINDPAISVDYVSYLMKFDSTHGRLSKLVTHNDSEIIIDDLHVKVYHEKYPSNVPWQCAAVEYVIEASGMFTNYEKASGHLTSSGVKRVIVTAPSVDIPMLVLGVNDKDLPPDCRVISCTSSTLYCLAPIIKVLEESFGVEDGFVTSIHAMTPSLKPLDGLCLRGRHWRDHRSIHQNIIPAPTGACKALGKIMPNVKDKLSGIAFRVPIVNVSVLDLTVRLQKNTTLQEIVKKFRHASITYLKNVIKVSNEEAVSSDFMADSHSCILDENSSIELKPNYFKIICWYENEQSYACRVLDSVIFSENQFYMGSPSNLTRLKPVMLSKILQTDLEYCKCSNQSSELISNVSREMGVETKLSSEYLSDKQKGLLTVSDATPKFRTTEDLIKMWNHRSEIKTNIEPVRCSCFQPYVDFPCTPIQKTECNTQERLDKVKREFTKMVCITEDLLRKTQSTQGVKSIPKVDTNSGDIHLRIKEDDTKTDGKTQPEINNNKIKSVDQIDFNCSGDTILVSNETITKSDTRFSCNQKSEFTDCHSNITGDSRNLLDITEDLKELDENEKEPLIELESKLSTQDILKNNEYTRKSTNATYAISENNRFSRNDQFRCLWNSPYDMINNNRTEPISKWVPIATDLSDTKAKHFLFQEKTKVFLELESLNNAKEETDSKTMECEQNKKSSTMKTNDNALKEQNKKPNIKTIDDELNELREKCSKKLNDDELRKRYITFKENASVNDNNGGKFVTDPGRPKRDPTKIGDDDQLELADPDVDMTVKIISEETSQCVTRVNTVTTFSGTCDDRQDIYDKLDSPSGSESNNSFEIKERDSQVIQLTDLSTSLEDLARLNNICRIIEISDELSDKLFSALDDTEEDMKKKRWSFKDLCTKLKLDDFCNKVFGGTPL